ncbi:MAG: anthranilate synthase component I [Desulfobacterota bacterium]|nr:anthranilate synthase component I [Thermodesulfobacteriota bacterium]MDW8002712.1 anthranilate synthase component I [Deltaproteobacteria bacterium]
MNYSEFLKIVSERGPLKLNSIIKEVLGDLDTPLSYYLKMKSVYENGPSFLFESAEKKEESGRYSIIGFDPYLIFKALGQKVLLSGLIEGELSVENPFEILKFLVKNLKITDENERKVQAAGAFGYVSYDSVRFFERIPDTKPKTIGCYDMYFVFPSKIAIFDNYRGKIDLISVSPEEGEEGVRELKLILRFSIPTPKRKDLRVDRIEAKVTEEKFKNMAEAAKKYIVNGDVIQVVLSQRLKVLIDAESTDIYRALRLINPSPYMFLLDFPEYSLIGSSPETMVRMKNSVIQLNPIAGTRPRGKTKEEDRRLEKDLLSDEKELAEHVMLVDLARNDVGRVSKIGSVVVERFLDVERYSHVMHIVSSVRGVLRETLDAFDVFASCFPAGTVVGAPKIRAMEIIEELEEEKREFYAGATGYFLFSGDMDFCITIRSLLMRKNELFMQAGAGIVFDSIPEKEYCETLNKLEALTETLRSIGDILK